MLMNIFWFASVFENLISVKINLKISTDLWYYGNTWIGN